MRGLILTKDRVISIIYPFTLKVLIPTILIALLSSCGTFDSSISKITCTTAQIKDYSDLVEAEGILEAKNNSNITVPASLNYRLEVVYLIPEGTIVKEGDLVVVLKDDRLENEYRKALDEIEITKAESKKRETELTEEMAQLETQQRIYKTSSETKEMRLKELEFIAPIKQEIEKIEIKKMELEGQRLQKRLEAVRNIHKEEIKTSKMKLIQVENKLKMYNKFRENLEIKSTEKGIITYAVNRRTGNKVEVGEKLNRRYPILKIPDLSVMQVKIQLNETDVQKLSVGQKSKVKISSLGDITLTGKLTNIDKVAKPVIVGRKQTKVKRVEAVIELDSTYAGVIPGLTAHCSIIVEEFEQSVVVPRECIFMKDSLKHIYVRDGRSFIQQEVEISFFGDNFAVIDKGLKGGERIAMREPDISLIKYAKEVSN